MTGQVWNCNEQIKQLICQPMQILPCSSWFHSTDCHLWNFVTVELRNVQSARCELGVPPYVALQIVQFLGLFSSILFNTPIRENCNYLKYKGFSMYFTGISRRLGAQLSNAFVASCLGFNLKQELRTIDQQSRSGSTSKNWRAKFSDSLWHGRSFC